MLPFIELTGLKVYELAGRLFEVPDGEPMRESSDSIAINANGSDEWFETRARLTVQTPDADIVADMGVLYTYSEPLEVGEAVAAEFVERVGIMAVYPFLREQLFTTASRLGVAPPVLGLLRPGTFKVNSHDEQTAAS